MAIAGATETIARLHQQSIHEHDGLAGTWYFSAKKFGNVVLKCFECPLAVPIAPLLSVEERVALLGKHWDTYSWWLHSALCLSIIARTR